jgi:O-succinylbenzoate synthase
MAVLDAELRGCGVPLADFLWTRSRTAGSDLGTRPTLVPAGVAVGAASSIAELVEEVGQRIEEGYRRVKLKIKPGWDVAPVRAVRDLIGDQVGLQVDANGSYAGVDPAPLHQLGEHRLLLIEQPLGDDDLIGHAALAATLSTPICLDESITSPDAASSAIALRACSVLNVKAGRVGGYLHAVEIHDRGMEAGLALWCGGMIESGIGRAANLALASLPGFSLPGDLSATDRYWRSDVSEPVELLPGGMLAVPSGPGLGVEVNLAALGGAVWRELLR